MKIEERVHRVRDTVVSRELLKLMCDEWKPPLRRPPVCQKLMKDQLGLKQTFHAKIDDRIVTSEHLFAVSLRSPAPIRKRPIWPSPS